MNLKKLRLSILLDVLSITVVIVGFVLIASSCRTLKEGTTTTTTVNHTETIDSDTVYQDVTVSLPFKGDSSEVVGNDITVLVRDSIVFRDSINIVDSIVYEYKTVNIDKFKINHPPVFSFTKYGYAKGWIENNSLNVSMVVKDAVIQAEIDSAIVVINNTKTITDSKDVVTTTVKTSVPFFKKLGNTLILVILLILVVVGIIIYFKYIRGFLW